MRSIKEVGNQETDIKKIQEYNKAFNSIKQMANDIMRTGKILTPFELLEIDKQLSEEELQQQKIDVEKNKNLITEEFEQVVIVDDTDKD